jgi:transcriptional regulator with XRE-family HTH domain
MMKQPQLGKRIAELRKAKGLTQDELVQKCNLSVRTLQRIESGEVIPRSYTVKIIFAALDCAVYNSSKGLSGWFIETGSIIFNWPGQFYKYAIDLFNLKTNTMKKLMILA